jgi:hypothetical protein
MKSVIITICFVLFVPVVCASGADRLVPSQYPTIQAAVNAAATNDTVIIAPGTYTGDGNRDIAVNTPITIRSQEGPETCIIDCNGSANQNHYGFMLRGGTLAGLTITRGYSSSGGAVSFDGSSNMAKLTNCILTGNIGRQGGAIFCEYGNLEIINCSLTNNSSGSVNNILSSGAIFCEHGSVLIENSTISGNSSWAGGGINCTNQGNVTIKNCVISDNSALSTSVMGGGGIYCDHGSGMVIIGSDISRNSALYGAGIYFTSETPVVISDCNIHDNVADGNTRDAAGGGIYYAPLSPSYGSTFLITNSSISNNVVRGTLCKGGGLYFRIQSSSYTPIIMLNGCVIARNSAQAKQNNTNSYGGGICVDAYGSSLQILLSETEVKENSAAQGGGIYNISGGLNLSRCKISGNYARFKGVAMYCRTGEIVMENCIISNHRFFENQSVIFCEQNPILKIANCTIVGNMFPLIYPSASPLSSMTNSIIYWNNQRGLPFTNFPVSYSDIENGYEIVNPGGDLPPVNTNIAIDPCFAISGHWDTNGTPNNSSDDFWVEGDYRLTSASPCIDSGGIVFLADNKDLAGNPRVMGAAIDMGAYENNNTQPVAEAGPDQNVFAWIDGNAAVILDGSKSYDPDGDKLSYLWNWAVAGNTYKANGVNPTINLPVGGHKIELIVNDMLANSQPDDVNITVIGPIEGRLWVIPLVINRQYGQPNILAMLILPASITKNQIDSGYKLLLYPDGIEAKTQYITQYGDNRIGITATFDKSALLTSVGTNGNVKLSVIGRLITGQYFFGQAIVWIFDPPPISYPPIYNK